jgi:hypothetical protein
LDSEWKSTALNQTIRATRIQESNEQFFDFGPAQCVDGSQCRWEFVTIFDRLGGNHFVILLDGNLERAIFLIKIRIFII